MPAFHSRSLAQRLSDTRVNLRRGALREVLDRPESAAGLVAVIVPLTADRDETVRLRAAEWLDQHAEPQPAEVPELVAVLRQTGHGEVQYWAVTMIGRIGSDAGTASRELANVLLDSDCLAARERAAWALAKIGPQGRTALNALRQIGDDDPPRLRRLAEAAITAIGQRAA